MYTSATSSRSSSSPPVLCRFRYRVSSQTAVVTTKTPTGEYVHTRTYEDPLEDLSMSAAPSSNRGEEINWHRHVDFLQCNLVGTHASYFEVFENQQLSSEMAAQRLWAGSKLQSQPLNKVKLDALKKQAASCHRAWTNQSVDEDSSYPFPFVRQSNEGVSVRNTLNMHPALSHTGSSKAIEQDDKMLKQYIPVAESLRQLFVLHSHHCHTTLDKVEADVTDAEVPGQLAFIRSRIQTLSALFKSSLLWPTQYAFSKVIDVEDPASARHRTATGLGPGQELGLRQRAQSVLNTNSQLDVVIQASKVDPSRVSRRPGYTAGTRGDTTAAAAAKAKAAKNKKKREQDKRRRQRYKASLAGDAVNDSSPSPYGDGTKPKGKGQRQKADEKKKKQDKASDKKESGNG